MCIVFWDTQYVMIAFIWTASYNVKIPDLVTLKRVTGSKFDKDQIRSINLILSDLKIEVDRYQKSGKLRSLLWFFLDIIDLINLFQSQNLRNSDLYQEIEVAISSSVHEVDN